MAKDKTSPSSILKKCELSSEIGRQMDEVSRQILDMEASSSGLRKTNKLLLHFLVKFSTISLIDQINKASYDEPNVDKFATNIIKKPTWSKIVPFISVFCSLKLVYSTYWHYVYDFQVTQLAKYKLKHENNDDNTTENWLNYNQTVTGLEDNLQASRNWLEFIGAPYLNAPYYFVEPCYVILLGLVYCTYFQPNLYFLFHKFNTSIITPILDRYYDVHVFNKEIRTQINILIESSRSFVEACLKQEHESLTKKPTDQIQFQVLESAADLRKVVLDHELTIRMLERMALDGSFGALNNRDWYDKLDMLFFNATFSNIIYSFVFDISLAWILPTVAGIKVRTDLMSLITIVELVALVEVTVIPTTFFIAIYVLGTYNLNRFIAKVNEITRECTQENDKRFYKTLDRMSTLVYRNHYSDRSQVQTYRWHVDTCYIQMNSNLLKCIIYYRVVVAKHLSFQKTFSLAVTSGAGIILTLPLILRVHMPYAPPSTHLNISILSFYFSVVCALFVNCLCIPICHIHCRGRDLTKLLENLLAHTVDHTSYKNMGQIYSRHSIMVLLKELSNTERTSNMFATKVFGVTFTYSSLLKLYFWWGVINLSSSNLSTSSYEHPVFGRVFNDPLRIHSLMTGWV